MMKLLHIDSSLLGEASVAATRGLDASKSRRAGVPAGDAAIAALAA